MEPEKSLTEKESLDLIASMINKARDSYHDTGMTAILWGLVIPFCSLERWAEMQFHYELPFDIYILTLAAIIPQVWITAREKKGRRVKSYDDAFMSAVWRSFGICIGLLIIIINIYFRRTGDSAAAFAEYIAPLFLLLYGIPTFITGSVCKVPVMFWGGILCWVCSIVTLFPEIKIDHLLIALSAAMAWLVPGILMDRDYRRAKKGSGAAHV